MDTERICPSCQKPLAPDVPLGLCPECLIKSGFPTGVESAGAKQPSFIPPTVEELATLFPQLEILELIGKGGMGAVYKARQPKLNRFVALKILPPNIGSDPAFAERFTREALALAQLNHPGIVTLYEFGQAGGMHFFMMEFVDGVNLRQLLSNGRIAPREALAIVPQICDALQFAHDQGIVHRDIKPENILLDRRGRVKVADFGLAKIIGSANEPVIRASTTGAPLLTETGKIIGTPQYMSPEQIAHPADVDHRADIYALGVVFYQMLTGELPGKQIEPPSKKVHIDVRLDEVVLRALEKKPELRYQQVSEVKACVETIAGTPQNQSSPATERQLLHFAGFLKFQSPLAFKFAQVACLGFLGFLGCLGFISGWERLFFLSGLFGFFGFGGIAYIIEVFARSKGNQSPIACGNWATWSPFASPEVREIVAHMTKREKRDVATRGALFGIWNAATCFAPVFILLLAPAPFNSWKLALAVCGVGFAFYPVWYKIMWELHCSTEWARTRGIKPASLRKFSFSRQNIGKALILCAACILVAFVTQLMISIHFGVPELLSHDNSFYIGQTSFPKGDSIAITSVRRTKNEIAVKGHYNLVSADNARLDLYITTSSTNLVPTDTKQLLRISRGQGDFELIHPHPVPGFPHVTMYGSDGKGFAGVYFGTKDEALEEGKLDLGYYPSSNGTAAAAQTLQSNTRDISSPTSPFRDTAKYLSPFTMVHFDTHDINKVIVAYNGSEYELAAIDDLPVADVLDFCRRQYGQSPFGEGWAQKRFAEDLVVVLSDMKHPVRSDNTVSLTLVDPQTGQQKIIAHAPMTKNNRAAIFQDRTLDNSTLLQSLPQNASFYIGHTWFPKGDSIVITSLKRTKEQMIVKGHYNLVSTDRARLCLFITTRSTNSTPIDPRQCMQISKGQGDFELTHPRVVPGLPHLNMWPVEGVGAFAELYFGTQAEAAEEGKLGLGYYQSSNGTVAAAQTLSFGPVLERVIQARQTGTNSFLDLDTGQLLTPPPDVISALTAVQPTDDAERFWQGLDILENTGPFRYIAWLRESGADLMFNGNGQVIAFDGNFIANVVIAHGESSTNRDDWAGLSPEITRAGIETISSVTQGTSRGSYSITRAPNSLGCTTASRLVSRNRGSLSVDLLTREQSVTWFFKTRKGSVGILQITGFTENPPGVKIRYQLCDFISRTGR